MALKINPRRFLFVDSPVPVRHRTVALLVKLYYRTETGTFSLEKGFLFKSYA